MARLSFRTAVCTYTPVSRLRAAPPTTGGYAVSRSAQSLLQERAMGFEPTTSALGRLHSTTELRPHDRESQNNTPHPRQINRSRATPGRWNAGKWRAVGYLGCCRGGVRG